jgi:hypothetical protein
MKIIINAEYYFKGDIGVDCSNYGQIIGLLMPKFLTRHFPNLVLNNKNGIEYLYDVTTDKTYKVFTGRGTINCIPSVCKGAGRTRIMVDESHFECDGYFLVNTSNLNNLEIEIVQA